MVSLAQAYKLGQAGWSADDLLNRIGRIAGWLLSIQLECGAWRGGLLSDAASPSIFNTCQVLDGLSAASLVCNNVSYIDAARRGADWIVAVQSEDGSFNNYIYDRDCRTYLARAALGLARLSANPKVGKGSGAYRDAAIKLARWVMRQQLDSGWIRNASFFTRAMSTPYTVLHTVAYAIEGLLEIGAILEDEPCIRAAVRASNLLMVQFAKTDRLPGEFTADGNPIGSYICVTGCAQMGLVWGRIHELIGDKDCLEAMTRMNSALVSVQLKSDRSYLAGGFLGSLPVYERYMPNRLPNWATKFVLDSLLLEERNHQNSKPDHPARANGDDEHQRVNGESAHSNFYRSS